MDAHPNGQNMSDDSPPDCSIFTVRLSEGSLVNHNLYYAEAALKGSRLDMANPQGSVSCVVDCIITLRPDGSEDFRGPCNDTVRRYLSGGHLRMALFCLLSASPEPQAPSPKPCRIPDPKSHGAPPRGAPPRDASIGKNFAYLADHWLCARSLLARSEEELTRRLNIFHDCRSLPHQAAVLTGNLPCPDCAWRPSPACVQTTTG